MALPYLIVHDQFQGADDFYMLFGSGIVRRTTGGQETDFLKEKGVPTKNVNQENAHKRLVQMDNVMRGL